MAIRIHGTFGSWVLPQGASVLGRGTTCDVRIDDPRLSRNHARFHVSGHQLHIEELGSRNGVLVDGRRVTGKTELRHGQVVVCGPVVLMVSIDQTQPHPRAAEGEQEPTTKRTSGRGDTEAMLAAVVVAESGTSGGRGIDPAIFAAVTGSTETGVDPARASALQPAPMASSITSPLEAVRTSPTAVHDPPPKRRNPSTSSLEAPLLAPNASGALEMPSHAGVSGGQRLMAGLIDGLAACGAAGIGLLVGLVMLAAALVAAGATVVDGVPRIGQGEAADFPAVLGALLHPLGLSSAFDAAPLAASSSPLATVLLIAGAALTAMTIIAGLLLVLVLPTVLHGAPRMHRQYGLRLVRMRDGHALGYGRALARWLLAGLLWPLAIPAALLRRRSPHDLLTGCVVRRTH